MNFLNKNQEYHKIYRYVTCKTKTIFTCLIVLFFGINTQAQLLDKLKQRAKEKGLTTQEVSYDSTENAKNKTYSQGEDLEINSAKDFFTTDIVMKMYYNTNDVIQTKCFDADKIAMRTDLIGEKKPMYNDKDGYFYAYNPEVSSYEKTKLLSSGMMGFMTAGIIPKFYKLPAEPYLDAFKALEEKNISLNFLILELAFIYKPVHFEDDDYYTPQMVTCNGSNNCMRFDYNDPEYPGSYIQFDNQGRLSELYINTINPNVKKENHPTGKFVYSYQDCSVKLPDAIEKSMMPGLFKMLKMERGLEPWKHNKKDKQNKNKNNN